MPLIKETAIVSRRSFRELVPQEVRTKRLKEVEDIYERQLAEQSADRTAGKQGKRKSGPSSPAVKTAAPTAEDVLSPQFLEPLIKKGKIGQFIGAAIQLDDHERKRVIDYAVNSVSAAIVQARQEKGLPPERQSRSLGKLFRSLLGVDYSDGRDVRSAMAKLEETNPDAYIQVVASLSVSTLGLIDGVGEGVENVRHLAAKANTAVNALIRDDQMRRQMAAAGFEPEVKPKPSSAIVSAGDIADSKRRDRLSKLSELTAEIVSRDLNGGALPEEDCDCDLVARFARRALDSPAKENAFLRLARKGDEDAELLLKLTSWRLGTLASREWTTDED